MPSVIGFSIAKNCIREGYPIDLVIKQHTGLFDMHIVGVPRGEQDEDGTGQLVARTAAECGQALTTLFLDWPGEGAWTEESLDKTHQQKILDHIEATYDDDVWVIKIDADEFYHEQDFADIREAIEICHDGGIDSIWTGYKQFMGSLNYTVWDPTTQVFHIFRNKRGVQFGGNDAMILVAGKDPYPLDEVTLNHIGYVKPARKINTRIHEHLILNESMYPGIKVPEDWNFTFPRHVEGKRLWPLGIAEIKGQPNEAEYFTVDPRDLPKELREQSDEMMFHNPM